MKVTGSPNHDLTKEEQQMKRVLHCSTRTKAYFPNNVRPLLFGMAYFYYIDVHSLLTKSVYGADVPAYV